MTCSLSKAAPGQARCGPSAPVGERLTETVAGLIVAQLARFVDAPGTVRLGSSGRERTLLFTPRGAAIPVVHIDYMCRVRRPR